ncbi:MAG: hypothetical protein IJJ65_08720 [Butyrivibrio sp.]|nr:hypothetical protein [Butyrivibrio sp.]
MMISKMKEFVENKTGKETLVGLDEDGWEFYYRAMHDHDMDLSDADRWAWLNTLFGYDIGESAARKISNWLYENGQDACELTHKSKETLKSICEFELGLHLDFSKFVNSEPEAYKYHFAT